MNMNTTERHKQSVRIPAKTGYAVKVTKGSLIRVTDLEGQQVVDFVAYDAQNANNRLDPGVTMDVLRSYRIKPGQSVYSNQYQPLLKIVRDTVGVHDFFNSACRPEMYEVLYGKKDHASCYHNLNQALEPFGILPPDQHYPFNLFMKSVVDDLGKIDVVAPDSRAGDYVEMEALTDLVIGLSACPCEESSCNGYHCTAIQLDVEPIAD
ncbi:urea carboxylase-associated family protein [Paenibacillus sp. E222]|uniref:urea carboxylase-associated family protein n=1 Tax=Paenibacillus sp. E222 TaxID=2748863 RepID=UPI00211B83B1|nr:urea carboxylase-associated family protein [Paenibacillus sp. E222]